MYYDIYVLIWHYYTHKKLPNRSVPRLNRNVVLNSNVLPLKKNAAAMFSSTTPTAPVEQAMWSYVWSPNQGTCEALPRLLHSSEPKGWSQSKLVPIWIFSSLSLYSKHCIHHNIYLFATEEISGKKTQKNYSN